MRFVVPHTPMHTVLACLCERMIHIALYILSHKQAHTNQSKRRQKIIDTHTCLYEQICISAGQYALIQMETVGNVLLFEIVRQQMIFRSMARPKINTVTKLSFCEYMFQNEICSFGNEFSFLHVMVSDTITNMFLRMHCVIVFILSVCVF